MKKLMLAAFLSSLALGAQAETYKIDPHHTFPNFTINHLGFSTMHGQFTKTSGTVEMDKSAGTGKVDITIETNSVYTGYSKRDEHLRSPDFFNAVEFPEITFKSTRVKFSGDGAKVTGDLTIKGTTKSVVLNVDHIHCGKSPFNPKVSVCGFNATTQIKRSDFGVNYGLPAIGDEVNIDIEAEADR